MKKIFGVFLFLLISTIPSHADFLGCFEPSDSVTASVQFNGSSGEVAPSSVTARVLDPNDTTTPSFTPTMSAVDGVNAIGLYRGSFTLGASPLLGTWTVRYVGTISGNNWGGVDTFEVKNANECGADYWAAALPGTYGAGTAGNIIDELLKKVRSIRR